MLFRSALPPARAGRPDHPGSADDATAAGGAGHANLHRTLTVPLNTTTTAEAVAAVLTEAADLLVRAKGFVRDARGRWAEVQLAGGAVTVDALPGPAPARADLVLIAAGPKAADRLDRVAAELQRTTRPL